MLSTILFLEELMPRHPFTLLVFLFALVLGFFIGPKIAQAVGPINYWPFKGTRNLNCGYHLNCGEPPDYNGFGTDWGLGKGQVTYAAGRGTVAVSGWAGLYGWNVTMSHSSNYWSRYAHLWYHFPAVNHVLAPGMPVGYTGNTGCNPPCGSHLHWHVYQQTTTPNGGDGGVQPAPIPMPAPTPSIAATVLTDANRGADFTNNTNYDNNVYGCDETYDCFTFSGSGVGNCVSVYGADPTWDALDIVEGYFWQGANDGARVYQKYCNNVVGNGTPTVTGIWRPAPPPNQSFPTGVYRIYVFIPDHPPSIPYSTVFYEVWDNGIKKATIGMVQNGFPGGDLVHIGTYGLTGINTYVKLANNQGTNSSHKVAYDAIFWSKE